MKQRLIALAFLSACSSNSGELKSTEGKATSSPNTLSGNGTDTQTPPAGVTPEELNPEATAPSIVSGAFLSCSPASDGLTACYSLDSNQKKQKYGDSSKVSFLFVNGSNEETLKFTALQGEAETIFLLDLRDKGKGEIVLAYNGVRSKPYHTDWLPTDPTEFMAAVYTGSDLVADGWFDNGHLFGDANNEGETACATPTGTANPSSPDTGTYQLTFTFDLSDVLSFYIFDACGIQTTDASFTLTGGSLRPSGIKSTLLPGSKGNLVVFKDLKLEPGVYFITFENKGYLSSGNRDNMLLYGFNFSYEKTQPLHVSKVP